ncbi:hypothetical protein LV84_03389 [Algoriphagus ratkowskyi]|uniref:Uncharacterized protein n=1 Tax=Algoriphagus ratkowskyi TaxID=57028 RepID=A0A2W7REX2_9BACT|nr:hypothetical protein [Algoriphagus ratkowskyi]PZX52779.1 hypothetical protein LV84_03389 [Algoriphagus ratkowskyi]TXD76278.1 hypothetical protein ESW18_16995 [Algoriphagus ratkowskyi]
MKKSNDHTSGIVIEFDSGIIPPPYSHVYRLSLDWSNSELIAELELHYTDREDLMEDEILDEGFTSNDDFSFKGKLDYIWKKVISIEYEKTKWSGRNIEEGGIVLSALEQGKAGPSKAPVDQENWQMLAQDVIQAIYETSKKEAPLTVNYRQVTHEESIDCAITMNFSNREAVFQLKHESRTINWEYAVQLLKLVFSPDYNYDLAKETAGTTRGEYIECGDGYWHELGKGVINVDTTFDAVQKIKDGFENLIEE